MAGFSYKNSYDNYWDYAYDMFLGGGGGGGGSGAGAGTGTAATGTGAGWAGAAIAIAMKEWLKGNTKWDGTKWVKPDDLPGTTEIPETGNDLPGTTEIPETGNDLPGKKEIPETGNDLPGIKEVPGTGSYIPGPIDILKPESGFPGIIDIPGTKGIDIFKPKPIDKPKTDAFENTGVKPLTGIFSETGSWLGLIPGLTHDNTNDNIEMSLNNEDVMSLIKGLRNEQWAREDEIRKETQEREDNAWQRAVTDMNRAGVNANLVNAGPAESGGGITNATGADTNVLSTQLQNETSLLKQFIDQNFQGNEKAKDRLITLITSIIQVSGHMAVAELFKKK